MAVNAPSDLRKALNEYLSAANEHLVAHDADVDRMIISPSPVTWDGGCDGQVWSRVETMAPVEGDTNAQLCGVPFWIATFGVGIIRRIATVGNSGASPYAEDVTADALQQVEDSRILKDAILDVPYTRTFVSWSPLAPQGGFAGGEWQFTVRLPNVYRSREV